VTTVVYFIAEELLAFRSRDSEHDISYVTSTYNEVHVNTGNKVTSKRETLERASR